MCIDADLPMVYFTGKNITHVFNPLLSTISIRYKCVHNTNPKLTRDNIPSGKFWLVCNKYMLLLCIHYFNRK